MRTPNLPPECLELIIKNVAVELDSTTLSALLRVNRSFFNSTLPFLYSNPLQFLSCCDDDDIYQRAQQLIALLLQCSNVEFRSELLLARYDIDTSNGEASISTPISNYLSHLRHFQTLDARKSRSLIALPSFHDNIANTRLVQFVYTYKLHQVYLTKEHQLEINPYQDPNSGVLLLINFALQRDITWALCSPVLDQIRTLTIPLSDIARYQQSIHRLQLLREVTFHLDEKIMPARHVLAWLEDQDMEAHEKILQNQQETLEAMRQFVQTHVDVHKNVLRKINCPSNKTWIGCPQTCPEETFSKLVTLLPSS
ncbi:hypothetical protein MVEG_01500 [Podila verticillata NRRL 6337]|nr:MAG: hypothetical protein BYD32DRAFT_427164 [Podila humilis]KFH71198.1 hypothetical protein MVEG_01500 [Podila verticillata NRRL 6337]